MTYCFGKGQFWPLMLLIGIHVMAIAIGCVISRVHHIRQELNLQLVLYSCLFGLANIYCPNWISYQNSKEERSGTHSYTILREFVIQVAFILENIAMLSVVVYSAIGNENSVIYRQTVLMYLAIIATVVHLVGVGLRIVYYKNYHIWRKILWLDFKNSCKMAVGLDSKVEQSNNSQMNACEQNPKTTSSDFNRFKVEQSKIEHKDNEDKDEGEEIPLDLWI